MMQESGPRDSSERQDSPPRDWRQRIAERLADTHPRHAREDWLIPGLSAAQSRAHQSLFPASPTAAAVLIPLIERAEGLTVLLTQRGSHLKRHAGQISFPGGRIEPRDEGPRAAALREACEEIGLDARFVAVAGYLPDHILLTGFRVTPVVGFVRLGFELVLDEQEVEEIFEVPLHHVFEPRNHRVRRRRMGRESTEVEVWDIPYGERNIWGATAGMLVNLYRLCAGEAPRERRGESGR